MLLLMMVLIGLFALLVITFLIQYRSYNHSQKHILSAGTPLTEDRDISRDDSAGLQLALNEEVTVAGYAS
jgi:hypothetical protein